MLTQAEVEADDVILRSVAARLASAAGGSPELIAITAQLVRRAIDEVIDAPRTGRLLLDECEKTEKTYLGTKIEVLFRSALGLPKGNVLDLSIDGREVDIKHTIGRTWMIPREALGHVCLLINENEKTARFSLGALVCRPQNLRIAPNQDKKLSVSASGLTRALWVARDQRYPPNIWQHMPGAVRSAIFSESSASRRVAALFRINQRTPIPRTAITAIAPQLDPLKRVRSNGGARDILTPERVAVLWGSGARETVKALGLPALYSDEFISIKPASPFEDDVLVGGGHLPAVDAPV